MSRDKVDVAKRVTDAYNRRDVDGLFAELATPDFEWYPAIVRALDGGGYRGREDIEEFAQIPVRIGRSSRRSPRSSAISATRCLCLEGSKGAGRAAAHRSIRHTRASSIFAATGSGATGCISIVPRAAGGRTVRVDAAQPSPGRPLPALGVPDGCDQFSGAAK
jgi:hypothetical protein